LPNGGVDTCGRCVRLDFEQRSYGALAINLEIPESVLANQIPFVAQALPKAIHHDGVVAPRIDAPRHGVRLRALKFFADILYVERLAAIPFGARRLGLGARELLDTLHLAHEELDLAQQPRSFERAHDRNFRPPVPVDDDRRLADEVIPKQLGADPFAPAADPPPMNQRQPSCLVLGDAAGNSPVDPKEWKIDLTADRNHLVLLWIPRAESVPVPALPYNVTSKPDTQVLSPIDLRGLIAARVSDYGRYSLSPASEPEPAAAKPARPTLHQST
jgi:hypothetical protein